jgi:hypothetical protein
MRLLAPASSYPMGRMGRSRPRSRNFFGKDFRFVPDLRALRLADKAGPVQTRDKAIAYHSRLSQFFKWLDVRR